MSTAERSTELDRAGVRSDDERYPVDNPGVEHEPPRWTDVDTDAGNAAYRFVVGCFALVPVFSIAFVVIYFAVPETLYIDLGSNHYLAQHVLLGFTLGMAILLVGVGAVQWGRLLMVDNEITEERHTAASSAETRAAAIEIVYQGLDESGLQRRKLIGRSLLGALGILLVPAVVTLADLGPWPTRALRAETIEKTIWGPGVRLVNDVTYEPILAADLEIGQLVNAEPATITELHGHEVLVEKAKSAIIVVRMDPNSIKIPASRTSWQVNGILCYSKICTHVGCPISLWEQQTHHLLCPCHQSTFDLGNSGVVVFGPAARSLPQLPITTDEEGYLIAISDFTVPVGPSYFERDSRNDYQEGDS
ncbi:menaquinol-cytochrome c reductase iron-sulfur subunit precursor [Auraticoccus monumenti]|uniref:Cytochrome bc1 complex Rieske iron-sulfur subunit n=1 Tax=Auraticoccus monumenti TaxID=675864 RepID=A0A1G7DUJ6_9ACTN|nr:menaquinol-cytochrome c reductase iron-sulfur subunit precursor [Auraticoccus monumenti]